MLTNGSYFGTTGSLDLISEGTVITETTTLFVYTPVSGTCPAVENSFTVTIETALNAGISGNLTICVGINPTNEELFQALGGSPDEGGIWSGPVEGVYTYTFAASGSCPEYSTILKVTEISTSDDEASGMVCIGETYTFQGEQYGAGVYTVPQVGSNVLNF